MKTAIVVYSNTGHTLAMARQVEERLSADGHTVVLMTLETVKPLQMSDTTAELKSLPDVAGYEAVILACPVRGGRPAPPMRVYLEQASSLKGKRVAFLVNGFFPAAWGRNQTLAEMQALAEAQGATVVGMGSVRWSSLRRRGQIMQAVDHLAKSI